MFAIIPILNCGKSTFLDTIGPVSGQYSQFGHKKPLYLCKKLLTGKL